jgi:hypothetical protein
MPEPRTCPRCEGCDHEEPRHHWIDDGATLTGFACKHCPAIAVECCACGGGGVIEDDDDYTVECPACHGAGYVEVVAITLDEVNRLRSPTDA